MKFSIHQKIALWWTVSSPILFASVISNASRTDANEVVAWGVTIVAMMILSTPLLWKSSAIRRLYCWTDALSQGQKMAIKDRDFKRYVVAALDDNYVARVTPYLLRVILASIPLLTVAVLLPSTGLAFVDAVIVFCPWYFLGVIVVIVALSAT